MDQALLINSIRSHMQKEYRDRCWIITLRKTNVCFVCLLLLFFLGGGGGGGGVSLICFVSGSQRLLKWIFFCVRLCILCVTNTIRNFVIYRIGEHRRLSRVCACASSDSTKHLLLVYTFYGRRLRFLQKLRHLALLATSVLMYLEAFDHMR